MLLRKIYWFFESRYFIAGNVPHYLHVNYLHRIICILDRLNGLRIINTYS